MDQHPPAQAGIGLLLSFTRDLMFFLAREPWLVLLVQETSDNRAHTRVIWI